MSKVNALYHIVFCTKGRAMTIEDRFKEHLYRFLWKLIEQKGCHLYRIGGIPNHLHILLDLNPRVALSDLVRDLKANSSAWMKREMMFPNFNGWGKEYFAATVSYSDRNSVIEYIKSQQTHHGFTDCADEFRRLCQDNNMELHEGDLE